LGVIATNARAGLLVIDGNPLEDLELTCSWRTYHHQAAPRRKRGVHFCNRETSRESPEICQESLRNQPPGSD
jgi:hypothetical protein